MVYFFLHQYFKKLFELVFFNTKSNKGPLNYDADLEIK